MITKQSNSSVYHGLDIALGHARRMNTVRASQVDGMMVNVDGRQPTPTPPAPDWPTLMDTPAFRAFCEATVRADEAERRAERED